uniref:Uncharacterized protein n=1 Tax=Arundo donax TaxID=35708 RepID=A0A0A9D8Y4_ARUDO
MLFISNYLGVFTSFFLGLHIVIMLAVAPYVALSSTLLLPAYIPCAKCGIEATGMHFFTHASCMPLRQYY